MFQIHKTRLSASIDSIRQISEHDDLSKKDFRVLFFLMGQLDSMRFTKVSPKKIGEKLNLSKSDVDYCIANLEESGILISGEDEHVKGYKFNL